jgi:type I restriction enzyme S subunit
LEGLAKLLYDYWFVQFEFPLTAAQAAALGKPKPVLGIRETDIIKHCFIYPFILREIPRYMILRTGAQQPHINKGTVDETPLVIPAAETLKAYTAIAAPIFEQIRNLQHQTQELTALRDWLLPLLMNGQVRVG